MPYLKTLAATFRHRNLVRELAATQTRDRYSGSIFGVAWSIVQPLTVIAVYWFVFVYALRITSSGEGASVVSYLLVGLAGWLYFNEALIGGVSAVTSRAYLVKKVAFPLEILPITPTLGNLMPHLVVLIVLSVGLSFLQELSYARIWLLPYFLFSLMMLAIAISYWLAAINVFFRDTAQTVTAVLQLWFWLSPIVWSSGQVSESVSWWLSWNPMSYIVNGYRFCLLSKFDQTPSITDALIFWGITGLLLIGGTAIFERTRHDFADVL